MVHISRAPLAEDLIARVAQLDKLAKRYERLYLDRDFNEAGRALAASRVFVEQLKDSIQMAEEALRAAYEEQNDGRRV